MKTRTVSHYETVVLRAITCIQRELDVALDLGTLAKDAALSPLHFHRIFRGMVGETPLELHRRLRLERSAHALATSETPVVRLAFEAGYETHESFTRAFGACYGLAPSVFRQRASEAREACTRPPVVELRSSSGIHFTRHEPPVFSREATNMKVDHEELPELRIAALRHIGPYQLISEAFARLGAIAGPAKLFLTPGTMMIALYHDDPEATPASELRSDAGLTLAEDVPLPSGTSEMRVPAGRHARTTHVGPYATISDTWIRFMGGWLPASGEELREGPSFEIYRNTPMDTPAEKLVTDIYLPVR